MKQKQDKTIFSSIMEFLKFIAISGLLKSGPSTLKLFKCNISKGLSSVVTNTAEVASLGC